MGPGKLRHWKGKEFPCWSIPGGFGLSTYGTGVDVASDVLRQGGPPVLPRDGLICVRNTWMSSGDSCLCPGQQPIHYPHGNIDALRRTVRGSGLPLQSLANVHIYIPDHWSYDWGGRDYNCTLDRSLSQILETGQGIGLSVL